MKYIISSVEKDGIQVMGIDILPAELPIESSEHFSKVLYPFIKDLVSPTLSCHVFFFPTLIVPM